MKLIKKSESDIKAECNPVLKKYGKFVPYNPYPYGEPGTPDKIGIINGQMILIEFKIPGKEPTALQLQRHREWEMEGAVVLIVHSRKELIQKISGYARK